MIEAPTKDAQYCASYTASHDFLERRPDAWEYIKRCLIQDFMGKLFPSMIDDGLYHVMKFDFYKYDRPDLYWRGEVEYRLVCKHTIAHTERYRIIEPPELTAIVRGYESQGFKKACRYCGNVLILSSRGACNACGGPAGEQ